MKLVQHVQDIFLLSGLFYCDRKLVVSLKTSMNYKLHLKENVSEKLSLNRLKHQPVKSSNQSFQLSFTKRFTSGIYAFPKRPLVVMDA